MSKKGQALVEFIIILPVAIMLIFCIIDFGRIFYFKTEMESKMDEVISQYKQAATFESIEAYLKKEDKNITFKVTNENNEYLRFQMIYKLDLMTPGLNLILGNPFNLNVKRVIYYE